MTSSNDTPLVETRGLSKRFGGTVALRSLSLTVKPGITGLIGANGAGKTTLLKLIMGLLTPSDGSVRTMGANPTTSAPARALVAFSPDQRSFPEDMPADEFVRHMARLRLIPWGEAKSRASDALSTVGLGEERSRPLGTMSTGQRQRVKLAQAIVADPRLILLDEPAEGLDPIQRRSMLNVITDVRQRHGLSVLLSSHVMSEVESICEHVIALDAGTLTLEGTLQEVIGTSGDDAHTAIEIEVVPDGGTDDPAVAFHRYLLDAGLSVTSTGDVLLVTWDTDDDQLPVALAAARGASPDERFDALARLCTHGLAETGAYLRRMGPPVRSLEEAVVEASEANQRRPPAIRGRGSGPPGRP